MTCPDPDPCALTVAHPPSRCQCSCGTRLNRHPDFPPRRPFPSWRVDKDAGKVHATTPRYGSAWSTHGRGIL